MKEFKEAFQNVERQLTEKRGPFTFFALALRENASDRWDLLVAAPWLDEFEGNGVKVVATSVALVLGTGVLTLISQIVVLKTNNPAVLQYTERYPTEDGWVEVGPSTFLDQQLRQAYIVTARKEAKSLTLAA